MRQTYILWGALFASTFVYLLVLFLVPHPTTPEEPMMLYAIAAAAFMSAVMSIVMSRRFFQMALSRRRLEVREEPDTSQVQYRDQIPMRRLFADPEAARRVAVTLHRVPFILGMALAESVAIFGFVLGFLGFPLPQFVPFFGVCWALMLFHFPRLGAIERAVETANRAKF